MSLTMNMHQRALLKNWSNIETINTTLGKSVFYTIKTWLDLTYMRQEFLQSVYEISSERFEALQLAGSIDVHWLVPVLL